MLRRRGKLTLLERALLLAALCAMPAAVPGSGGGTPKAEKKDVHDGAKADGHSSGGGAAAKPAFAPGPPLAGHFDRYTLRSSRAVTQYRHLFKGIKKTINLDKPWQVRMGCAIEFGSEAGMAEVSKNPTPFLEAIQNTIEQFEPRDLMSPSGKIRLKEAIAATLNKKLGTAMVRQVYLTDFVVLQGF